jgi:hypothetical protein
MVRVEGLEPPKLLGLNQATLPICPYPRYGAVGETRTPDLMITNQLLYRLSYYSILVRDERVELPTSSV